MPGFAVMWIEYNRMGETKMRRKSREHHNATFDFRRQQNRHITFQYRGLALQAMQTRAAYDEG